MICEMRISVNPAFPYEPANCRALRRSLSDERFAPYLGASGGDEIAALRLYAWNTAVAGAFYGPLQACEVTLRNHVHSALSARYGRQWFESCPHLSRDELRMAKGAIESIRRRRKDPAPGRVVAELGFGYWVSLFANRYDETLWRADLVKLFSPRPRRRGLHDRLDRLRTPRNRIAHHEPIHQRDLTADFQRIVDILTWLDPMVADWAGKHSRVPNIIVAATSETYYF